MDCCWDNSVAMKQSATAANRCIGDGGDVDADGDVAAAVAVAAHCYCGC